MSLKQVHNLLTWASGYLAEDMRRMPGIPGTRKALDREVQANLRNHVLSHEERGKVAASLITSKVLLSHRIST